MKEFRESYNRTLGNVGGVSGTFHSTEYADGVQKAIDDAVKALQNTNTQRQNTSIDYLKGWLAEQWHAETLKTSAAARDRSDIWAYVPGDNKPGSDIRYGNSISSHTAESKYHKSASATTYYISKKEEYNDQTKIVPSDQKHDVIAEAQRLALKKQINNPEQAANYSDTARNTDETINIDSASSKPLSEPTAMQLAKDLRHERNFDPHSFDLNSKKFVEWSDIVRESGEAALTAAVLSAAISTAPQIWRILKYYHESGTLDLHENSLSSASILDATGAAGLRGGIAATLVASCKTGLMGDSLVDISPLAIGMATTMTLNVIRYSIRLQRGTISNQEFAHHCLRDSFVLSSAISGAFMGQLIIPIPMLGAMIGNIVGAALSAVLYEGLNHVVLGFSVNNGWSYFGIVKQDYTVPEEVLKQAGYDIFSRHSFPVESFPTKSFDQESFNVNSLSFTPVRRGVIACNAVGYVI